MNDRQARGLRADAALKEFLSPAFELVKAEYMTRLAEIAASTPWETGKISKLAIAARIAEEVEGQIKSLVDDGRVAQDDTKRAARVAALPYERRKILGLL